MTEALSYSVPGIHCAHCAMSIREEVSELDGVESVEVDLDAKVVTVHGSNLTDEHVRGAIAEAGYEAT